MKQQPPQIRAAAAVFCQESRSGIGWSGSAGTAPVRSMYYFSGCFRKCDLLVL